MLLLNLAAIEKELYSPPLAYFVCQLQETAIDEQQRNNINVTLQQVLQPNE